MDRQFFDKAKEIEDKLSKVEKVINAVEDKKYDYYHFALCVGVWEHDIPFDLPRDMTNDMLEVCRKYKSIYEKQLEEL